MHTDACHAFINQFFPLFNEIFFKFNPQYGVNNDYVTKNKEKRVALYDNFIKPQLNKNKVILTQVNVSKC